MTDITPEDLKLLEETKRRRAAQAHRATVGKTVLKWAGVFAAGAVVGGIVSLPVASARLKARIAANEELVNDSTLKLSKEMAYDDDLRTKLNTCQDSAGKQDTATAARLEAAQQDLDRERQNAHAADGFVTMVYTPDQAAGQSAILLANLVKPGLGTALQKMAPPPQLKLRFILRGEVVPLVNPEDGSRFVITRIGGAQ